MSDTVWHIIRICDTFALVVGECLPECFYYFGCNNFLVRASITSRFCSWIAFRFVFTPTISRPATFSFLFLFVCLVCNVLPTFNTLNLCSFNTTKAVVIGRNLPLHELYPFMFTSVAAIASTDSLKQCRMKWFPRHFLLKFSE